MSTSTPKFATGCFNNQEATLSFKDLTVEEFIDALADGTPSPGGGSAAALVGTLAAALSAMVARLTIGREKFRDAWPDMEKMLRAAEEQKTRLEMLMDQDSEAYLGFLAATRLPKSNDEERLARQNTVQKALVETAKVPLEILRSMAKLTDLVRLAVNLGNPVCFADAGVATQFIRSAAMSAFYNVRTNLKMVRDVDKRKSLESEAAELLDCVLNDIDALEKVVIQWLE
ncbi:MAG: cyclodeaminase/cyclohydrolase family protein [Deltaproteobacteria bacterium]|nr:cyclodeaminase/cyclohydrolase family protein [Deltaproteobacteria bacterium]